jgi:hypothetical protein
VSVLVHIGYHKTATSWLQEHLFSNEDAGFGWTRKAGGSPVRRLVDDDPLLWDADDARAAIEPGLEAIRARGLQPVISVERLSGHPFSGGYDVKEIADRIAAVFPDGRVLAVVREQRSMIVSTYKQYVRAGGGCTVEEFLHPPTSKSLRVPWFDFRYFEYDRLLAYYRGLLGPERVRWLAYEGFATDPRGFVAAVCAFAAREAPEDLPYDARENKAPSAAGLEAQRRRNRLGFRSELNPTPALPAGLVRRLPKRFFRPPDRAAAEAHLRETVERAVGDRYRESNRRLAELTGLDLAALGWML